jgi:hypothetical protein
VSGKGGESRSEHALFDLLVVLPNEHLGLRAHVLLPAVGKGDERADVRVEACDLRVYCNLLLEVVVARRQLFVVLQFDVKHYHDLYCCLELNLLVLVEQLRVNFPHIRVDHVVNIGQDVILERTPLHPASHRRMLTQLKPLLLVFVSSFLTESFLTASAPFQIQQTVKHALKFLALKIHVPQLTWILVPTSHRTVAPAKLLESIRWQVLCRHHFVVLRPLDVRVNVIAL